VYDLSAKKIGFSKKLSQMEIEQRSQFVKWVIGFMVTAAVLIGGVLGYRWYKKRKLRADIEEEEELI
jgi:hypothetical protein